MRDMQVVGDVHVHHFRVIIGTLEELIKHGLRALRDTLPNEVDLTNKVLTMTSFSDNYSVLCS